MIPLRDENPTRSFPFLTIVLIVVNILVFLYEMMLGSRGLEQFVYAFGVVPQRLLNSFSLSESATLVSSLFMHADPMHLGGNMLYLWIFGNNIEDRLGKFKFLFFYFSCGIAASLGHVAVSSGSAVPTIGASGAISGVLGAYLILYPNARILTLLPLFYIWRIVRINASWFLAIWIIFQIISGTASFSMRAEAGGGGVAWFAHIAGFFAGIGLIYLLDPARRRRRWRR